MKGTTGELVDLPNICLASFFVVSSRNGQPGADDRVDPRTDDPTARWLAGRKDFAPQTCTQLTGAARTHSAGTLATAYPATFYFAGHTGVGEFFAPGDAHCADQRQAAQDSQTGTSYMALTRPSTARTGHPTAHRPPLTAQAQTAQGQIDRQRTEKAVGRESVPAFQSCMWMAGTTGAYSAGLLATAYPPTIHTGVVALVAPGDAQLADQRQAAHDKQTGTSYMASTRPSACTDEPRATRPPHPAQTWPHRSQLTGIGPDRHM